MQTYPFMQIDAFADRPLAGNPCVVVFEADDLSEETMLAVAKEMNLSETAFVRHSTVADFGARYFTPAREIPLAGHPTIATTFAMVHSGRLPLPTASAVFSLELKDGPISVEVFTAGGAVSRIVMSQRKPRFLSIHDPDLVLPLFGLPPEAHLPGALIQTVSTGTPQLMIPLRGLDDLDQVRLDPAAYDDYRARADFFSSHLFCLEGISPEARTFARHLDTPPGPVEDPFTGSATGGMAAYLWHHRLIDAPTFLAEQGHWMDRPGQASVEVVGPPEDIETVKVGGHAALVMEGTLILPPG
jgi:trans-2,3-dihydro-3-hydroxyanthranilate isomerase